MKTARHRSRLWRPATLPPYNSNRDGLASCLRDRLALRCTEYGARLSNSSVAIPSRARMHLLFRFFLSSFPNTRSHRRGWNFTRGELPSGCITIIWLLGATLVCADVALVVEQFSDVERPLLDRHAGILAARVELMAASNAGHRLCMFSLFCQRSSRLLWLSIRRDAVRSRIYLRLLRAIRVASGFGPTQSPFARQFVSTALGVVSHLLRVWRSETS